MANKTNLIVVLFLMYSSIILLDVSCKSHISDKDKKMNNVRVTEEKQKVNYQVFKTWINDTVQVLNLNKQKEKQTIAGLQDTQIDISPDSLSLEVIKRFEIDISSNTSFKKNIIVDNVLELLKEYDELPKGEFKLMFLTSNYYYPSSASDLVYDDLFELRDLKVINHFSTMISSYNYIRGRINEKKVVKNTDKKDSIEYYDFIWDGNKLKKIKRDNL